MTNFVNIIYIQPLTHSSKNRITYKFLIIVVAILYGVILAYGIPVDDFLIKDRANYFNYAENSHLIFLYYKSQGILHVFTNEPVWLFINSFLAFFLTPENVLRTIISIPAAGIAYMVLKVQPRQFIWLLFLLLMPQIIKNHIIHLRQGVAVFVFLLGWFSSSKAWRRSLFVITPFIHASFFFILFLLIASYFLKKTRFDIGVKTMLIIFLGFIISIGLEPIARFFSARQIAEYTFTMQEVSGLGFLFWSGIFILYLLEGKNFTFRHSFIMAVIAFYLSTYFLTEVTGRIFESAILLVLLVGLDLSGWRKQLYFSSVFSYTLISYLIRFNYQPWLG